MGSTLISGDPDPVPVNETVKVHHRIQLEVTGVQSGTELTVPNIVSRLPGGSSAWAAFRIIRVDVWGDPTGNANLSVANTAPYNDMASFSDYGTPGERRPSIHFRPNWETRSNWILTSATSNILDVYSNGTAGVVCVVNITLELQSVTVSLPGYLSLMKRSKDAAANVAAESSKHLTLEGLALDEVQ